MNELREWFRLTWSIGFYFGVAIFSFIFGFVGAIYVFKEHLK